MRTLEIIVSIVSVIGAIAISYVESRMIAKIDPQRSVKESLPAIYWHNLSSMERWLFWTGLALLFSPFLFALIAPR